MAEHKPQSDTKGLLAQARRLALSSTALKGYMSVIDQAFLSGTNFVTGILLARCCTKEEYGSYVIAFLVMVLLSRLQMALITSPMAVLGAQLPEDEFRTYASSLFLVQLLLALIGVVALLGVSAVMVSGAESPAMASALLGLACATLFMQAREFFRRMLFARLEAGQVLLNDVAYCLAVVGGLLLLKRKGLLGGRNAFFLFGGVAAVTSLLAAGQARRYLGRSLHRLRRTLQEQWRFGRWLLVETLSSYAHMDAVAYILAMHQGLEGTARLGAARNVLAPLQIVLFGIANIASPRAAAVFHHQGRGRMNVFLGKVAAVSAAIFAAYCLCAVFAPKPLLQLLYGSESEYLGEVATVRLWAVIYMILALRQVPTLGLSAMRRPDITVRASILSALLTVGLAFWLIREFSVCGALWARMGGEVLCLVLATFFLMKPGVEDSPVVPNER